jgi:hypothetical protein
MLPSEHHAEGFHYVVSYRRTDRPASTTRVQEVWDWRQSELVVGDQETYREYEVSVLAKNSLGDAPKATKTIGFSGEDVPLEIPQNFQLVEGSLNSTSAVFTWNKVDPSFARIRGFFRGYQIRFWRQSDPSNVRTENMILHQWSPCRAVDGDGASPSSGLVRSRRGATDTAVSDPVVRGSTSKLWPYSTVMAGVVVLNGALASDISNVITFHTPEGVPGPVLSLTASERGSNHIRLTWQAPEVINGLLTGYIIGYKPVTAQGGELRKLVVDDPLAVYKKIFDLKEKTTYTLTIWALTRVGRGTETVIQATTAELGKPDQPVIENVDIGYNYVVVSWRPSNTKPGTNPASDFAVEYQLEGSDQWVRADTDNEQYAVNVSGLTYGQTYDIRIVALSLFVGDGDVVTSEAVKVTVGMQPAEPMIQSVASSSWFIVLICLLILFLFILLVVLLLRYNRGGKYPLEEKEKRYGANGGQFDEENRFCEYVRGEDPVKKKSQGSLESSSRSEEDDEDGSDSLGVYEDSDPTKFNDEGSFIDQSGCKKTFIDGGGAINSPRV